MADINENLLAELLKIDSSVAKREETNMTAVTAAPSALLAVMKRLRGEGFEYLLNHTAVDYPKDNIIDAVYVVISFKTLERVMVVCRLDRANPVVPTVSGLYTNAELLEREAFDFFGVLYDDHPDLRRLFMEDDQAGWPLRKDYEDEFILKR